jgi:uncharacterized protein with PQ loop repeat
MKQFTMVLGIIISGISLFFFYLSIMLMLDKNPSELNLAYLTPSLMGFGLSSIIGLLLIIISNQVKEK